MLIRRSIPIIIEDDPDLRETLRNFRRVMNIVSPVCFNEGRPLSAITLHHAVYKDLPRILNSQMLCMASRLVSGAYAAAKRNKHTMRKPFTFRRSRAVFSIGPRGRDAAFRKDGKLSIWTIKGRKRLSFRLPEFSLDLFNNAVVFDSLSVTESNGFLLGSLIVKVVVPTPVAITPVGIDLNERNAVVASNVSGQVFLKTGRGPRNRNFRTAKVMRRLQSKRASRKAEGRNTRSIDRALKRLGKKLENRTKNFARDVAKKLCVWSGRNAVLVFENLDAKGFRKAHVKRFLGRRLTYWPHGIIRRSIEHKAEMMGIGVAKVPAQYTSKTCSCCGLRGERNRDKFECPHCGFKGHADINAAVNIRTRYTALRSSGLLSTSLEA